MPTTIGGWKRPEYAPLGRVPSLGGGTAVEQVYDPAEHAQALGVFLGANQYTLGCEFSPLQEGISCTAVKFVVGAAGNWRAKLWNQDTGVALATVDIVGGPGLVTASFAAIALNPLYRYVASYTRLDAASYYGTSNPTQVPTPASTGPEIAGLINYYSFARWWPGDVFPQDNHPTNRYPVGPQLEGSSSGGSGGGTSLIGGWNRPIFTRLGAGISGGSNALAANYDIAIHAQAIGVVEGAGQYTLGTEFAALTADMVCSGVSACVGEAGTWRMKLWNVTTGLAVASVDKVGGPGIVTGSFAVPVTLSATVRYVATYCRLDEATYFRVDIPSEIPVPTTAPEVSGKIGFFSFARWVAGDAFPSNISAGSRYPAGPVLSL